MSDEDKTPPGHPAHPANWGQALAIAALWLVARLPWRTGLRLGALLGRLACPLAGERRRIALRNIELCFPELDARQRLALVRRNFAYTGQGVVETALAWFGGPQVDRIPCTVTGIEHLEAARADGHAVILLSGHFLSLEITGRLVRPHFQMGVIYKPLSKQPLLDRTMRRARLRRGHPAVLPKDDVRSIVRTLRQGIPVWYAGDQNYRTRQKVFAPFFGHPTPTVTALNRLARMGKARVVPLFFNWRPDSGGYEIALQPALQDFPTDDPERDAATMNAVIERAVRRYPDQYLWTHRRFKDHPDIEDMYPDVPDHRQERRSRKRKRRIGAD